MRFSKPYIAIATFFDYYIIVYCILLSYTTSLIIVYFAITLYSVDELWYFILFIKLKQFFIYNFIYIYLYNCNIFISSGQPRIEALFYLYMINIWKYCLHNWPFIIISLELMYSKIIHKIRLHDFFYSSKTFNFDLLFWWNPIIWSTTWMESNFYMTFLYDSSNKNIFYVVFWIHLLQGFIYLLH